MMLHRIPGSWYSWSTPYGNIPSGTPRGADCGCTTECSWLRHDPWVAERSDGGPPSWIRTWWHTTTGSLSNPPQPNVTDQWSGRFKPALKEQGWPGSRPECSAVQVHTKRTQCIYYPAKYSTAPPPSSPYGSSSWPTVWSDISFRRSTPASSATTSWCSSGTTTRA